jgi:hypothetical protein
MASVSELVSEMRELRAQELKLEGRDPSDAARNRTYSPASADEVAAYESASGFPYPPSYREFLGISNGWLGFWPDWTLVGVPRDDNQDAYKDISATTDIIPDELNKAQQEELKQQEKVDASRILALNHMIFATDFNGGLMVFDRNRTDIAGEMQAVWVGYIYHVERRYPNFTALLEYAVNDTKKSIAKLQGQQTR